jgi:hypothetical protein
MSSAEPMTTSKAVAVNSSGIPAAATVYSARLRAKQREYRDQRYYGQVLEQEDGKGRAAVLRRQLFLLGQHLQDECRGR